MALINCPECGHQMSDTAKKCPNCGAPLKKSTFKVEKDIAISVSLLVVALGLLIGSIWIMCNVGYFIIVINDDNFFLSLGLFIGSFIPLFFGLRALRSKLKKSKLIFALSAMAFVLAMSCVFLTRGVGTRAMEDKIWDEHLSENQTKNEESAPVGTYQVTDKAGNKWLISVNEDETIVIEGTDNSAYYGSWDLYKGKIETSFTSDGFIYPPLIFPNSESTDGMYLVIDLKEDYIYASNSAESKNPRKRLPITKVK